MKKKRIKTPFEEEFNRYLKSLKYQNSFFGSDSTKFKWYQKIFKNLEVTDEE